VAAFAAAAPAYAAPVATVSAQIVRSLELTWVQDLSLGTITLGPGTWSGATIGISKTGAFSCSNSNVTCTGTTSVAQYTVVGTNKQLILISAPNVTMVNQSDSSKTLTLTVDSPGSVMLANSGKPGTTFSLGGSITVSSSTPPGVYIGTFDVTVDY